MATLTFDPASGSDFVLSGGSDGVCIDLANGFMIFPQWRGRDWIVPRLDGEVPGNRRKGKLLVPANGFIRGLGGTPTERRENFNDTVTAMITALDPSLGVGALELATGYLGLNSGQTASIAARVRNAAPGKITGYNTVPQQLWSIEFECYDPDWTIA